MKHTLVMLFGALLVVAGCEPFGGGEHATRSAALWGLDGGAPAPDADAGMPGADAGMPGADAGMPGADAGMPDADAGMPDADAGTCGDDPGELVVLTIGDLASDVFDNDSYELDACAVNPLSCPDAYELVCPPTMFAMAPVAMNAADPPTLDLGNVPADPKSVLVLSNLGKTDDMKVTAVYKPKETDKPTKKSWTVTKDKVSIISLKDNVKDYKSFEIGVEEPATYQFVERAWADVPCKWKINGVEKTGTLPMKILFGRPKPNP